MGKKIDFSKPLDEADEQYVTERPWLLEDQRLIGTEVQFQSDGFEVEEEGVDYSKLTIKKLQEEIAARNEVKEEDDEEIVAASDKKDDLIAALEADDAAEAEANE